jgi:Calcineurin-like phosphoesterase
MIVPRAKTTVLAVVAALACVQCGRGGASTPTTPSNPLPPAPTGPTVPTSGPEVFVGAGDIGWCNSQAPEQTARLLDGIGGKIFAAGDLAYMSGSADDFRKCYDPAWGRHKFRTFAVPGNHEYQSPGAAPFYDYFQSNIAGAYGTGFYSYPVGDWHVVALNSNWDFVPVGSGSVQAQWLRADLAMNTNKCTLAYWHHPLFTSGPNGEQTPMRDIWRILYDANVDVVVNAHDHLYERFAPQDPDGRPDPARGVREFVAGTGGAALYQPVKKSVNSEAIISEYGVLKFTLQAGAYQWEFIPVSGPGDSGTASCH